MERLPDARQSGTFTIGGDLTVHRLGFGAMRITGKGIWGPPEDPDEARRTLKRVPELGIDFIDTAESYGPYISEELIGEVLAPYPRGMVIATKSGLARHGPDIWRPIGRKEFLRQGVILSMRRLKVERIDLWQLHRIDARTQRGEQFEEIAAMQKEGLIRHVGLSEVTVDDIQEAQKYFRVATVQNLYNLVNRQSEAVLEYCAQHGIGFIPWYPLAAGNLSRPGGAVDEIARKHQVPPAAIALAWLLKRSPVMLPIPGTGKVKHLEENTLGANVTLTDEEFRTLDAEGKAAWKAQQVSGRS
ncbi:MAG: aldo/keto reductase [Myxococcaceae bacterium]|nr:aldo/keto reductase [Myxococcaceae bacterium]